MKRRREGQGRKEGGWKGAAMNWRRMRAVLLLACLLLWSIEKKLRGMGWVAAKATRSRVDICKTSHGVWGREQDPFLTPGRASGGVLVFWGGNANRQWACVTRNPSPSFLCQATTPRVPTSPPLSPPPLSGNPALLRNLLQFSRQDQDSGRR